ncbi:hypothetical protein [Bacillus sp. REN10]|uniref:hypothetical protein n=1 Tax=Bacillus sp. REN10 TaxID=2782541 RepID=UPI00193AFE44|nr:hypothetical protein [Bacillus sp. REN10]
MARKKKELRVSDLEYIAKYAEFDGYHTVSKQIGVSKSAVQAAIEMMRRDGTFDYFRNLNLFW